MKSSLIRCLAAVCLVTAGSAQAQAGEGDGGRGAVHGGVTKLGIAAAGDAEGRGQGPAEADAVVQDADDGGDGLAVVVIVHAHRADDLLGVVEELQQGAGARLAVEREAQDFADAEAAWRAADVTLEDLVRVVAGGEHDAGTDEVAHGRAGRGAGVAVELAEPPGNELTECTQAVEVGGFGLGDAGPALRGAILRWPRSAGADPQRVDTRPDAP